MTKKVFTLIEERVMRNRAQEIGFDLNFGFPIFSEPQKNAIRTFLVDKKVDLAVIEIIAKPDISAAAMVDLVRGSKNGLSLDDIRFLLKLNGYPIGKVMSVFRRFLQNKVVPSKILRKVFIKDDEYWLYSDYKMGSQCLTTPMVDLAKKLDAIHFFMEQGKSNRLFTEYITNKDPVDIQYFLSLSSELPEYERVDFLIRKLPLNTVYCYINYNEGKKSWEEFTDFISLHPYAKYYVKAFLDSSLDEVPNEKLLRFMDGKSNWLTDELFIVHGIDPSLLGDFAGYNNVHHTFGSSNLPKYAGNYADKGDEPAILANSIKEWLNKDVSSKEIAAFVFSTEKFKDFVVNVGLQYNVPIEDAVLIADGFENLKLYDHNIAIATATKMVKADYPIHEVYDYLGAKQLF